MEDQSNLDWPSKMNRMKEARSRGCKPIDHSLYMYIYSILYTVCSHIYIYIQVCICVVGWISLLECVPQNHTKPLGCDFVWDRCRRKSPGCCSSKPIAVGNVTPTPGAPCATWKRVFALEEEAEAEEETFELRKPSKHTQTDIWWYIMCIYSIYIMLHKFI